LVESSADPGKRVYCSTNEDSVVALRRPDVASAASLPEVGLRQLRRRGIGRVRRNLKFRFRYRHDAFTFACYPLQAGAMGRKVYKFRHS
jgi:hypothetical protein